MGWRLEKTSDGRERGCDRSSAGCVKHVKTNAHTKKVTGRCAGDCYPCMPCANIGAKQREATRHQFDSTRDRGRARRPLERVDAAAPNARRLRRRAKRDQKQLLICGCFAQTACGCKRSGFTFSFCTRKSLPKPSFETQAHKDYKVIMWLVDRRKMLLVKSIFTQSAEETVRILERGGLFSFTITYSDWC